MDSLRIMKLISEVELVLTLIINLVITQMNNKEIQIHLIDIQKM